MSHPFQTTPFQKYMIDLQKRSKPLAYIAAIIAWPLAVLGGLLFMAMCAGLIALIGSIIMSLLMGTPSKWSL